MLTRKYAAELGADWTVVSLDPGWVSVSVFQSLQCSFPFYLSLPSSKLSVAPALVRCREFADAHTSAHTLVIPNRLARRIWVVRLHPSHQKRVSLDCKSTLSLFELKEG